MRLRSSTDVETILASYGAIDEVKKTHAATIASYYSWANEQLQTISRYTNKWDRAVLEKLVAQPPSPSVLIASELELLAKELEELERLEHDPDAVTALITEKNDLTDRKKFSEDIETFVERRNHLEERQRVLACQTQCSIRGITRQITVRRRDVLTPTLRSALNNELRALQLTHIPLNMSDRGDLGDSIVEVALTAQQRIQKNSAVLSEGEQRGLALACFLAELHEIGRSHAIIVDDPVSSLDHTRMEAVAKRLSHEASTGRQVIVFTHSILFHHMLSSEARLQNVPCHQEWMSSRGNTVFGIIDNAQQPWHIKPAKGRLDEIERDIEELRAHGYSHEDEGFRASVVDIYTKMRTTWERVVEEVLFNKVVQRFRPEVMTLRLAGAFIDTRVDYPVIFEGMKRCSHYSGHDMADDIPPGLPELSHIAEDLAELSNFYSMAKTRRRELEKEMKSYEEGGMLEPEFV